MYRWKMCLGDCKSGYGLQGGIREVVLMNKALSLRDSIVAKNTQFTYDPSFKAYFRFQDQGNKFSKDEFVDREWDYFRN